MTSTVHNIAFDCFDAYRVGRFWSEVVGHPLADDDFPGDPVAVIRVPDGSNFYFAHVPQPKTGKNRVHVCLKPDIPRDDEVRRLLELGASIVDDRREDPDDGGWVVLADPEGNEFCVLRGATD